MRVYQCKRTDPHTIAECRDYRGPKVFTAPIHPKRSNKENTDGATR